MNPKAKLHFDNGCLYVSGDLTFFTVMDIWNQSLIFIKKHNQLKFDFSEVTQANSAAIALLLEWLKYAKKNGKTISFSELPDQLKSILRLSGMSPMFTFTGVSI